MADSTTGQAGADGKQAVIWCAVYVRKSTDENLDQAFNSLDNQREYCQSFIKSREPEGWRTFPEDYSDPGFSGGNMDRPGLKKLMADARAGKFKVVVCYKYDRLTRNTRDFLDLLEVFDQHNIHFVSVTQPIDTSSSVGRLMRSILMQFAQFEREMISERTRDKLAAMAKKGRRTAMPILGYDIDFKTKLMNVNEAEKAIVQEVFAAYLKTVSLSQTAKYLNEKGYRNKEFTTRDGTKRKGGASFDKSTVQYLLRNPVYIGKIRYKGILYEGLHQAIVGETIFEQVGKLLAANNNSRLNCTPTKRKYHVFLLKGLVRCVQCGSAMTPHYNGRDVRYYRCCSIGKLDKSACPTKAVNADALAAVVVERLSHLAQDKALIEKIVERARTHSNTELPKKRQEHATLEKQTTQMTCELRNLVAVLAKEGPQSEQYGFIMASIRELESRKKQAQDRMVGIEGEIQKLETQQIEADIIRGNLGRFGELFKELQPEEQRRLIQVFVRQVSYDEAGGKIRLELRPLPIMNIELTHTGELSKVVKTGCRARTRT